MYVPSNCDSLLQLVQYSMRWETDTKVQVISVDITQEQGQSLGLCFGEVAVKIFIAEVDNVLRDWFAC